MLQIKQNNKTTKINSDILCYDISCNTLESNILNTNLINVNDDIYINFQPYSPVGVINIYSGQNAPNGWLFCDGSEISRSTYSRLYSIIGTIYGAGDNSTTFNIPNLQELIPVGKSTNTNLGDSGGNNTITLTTDQLPTHTHTGTTYDGGIHDHSVFDPGHSHSLDRTINPDSQAYDANNSNGFTSTACTTDRGVINSFSTYHSQTEIIINDSTAHNHTFTTQSTGNGSNINIQNKFIILNYIIRY